MLRLTRFPLFRFGLVAISLLLAACATQSPPSVPVVERTPSSTPAIPVPHPGDVPTTEAAPAYYTVKRGDTLISIALQTGQDYKDIALWNNLESPYVIYVGQVLHVLPPDGAIALPVGSAPASAPVNVPLNNTPTFKIEPQGSKRPYSEAALAELSRADGTGLVAGTVPPVSRPEPPKADTDGDANLGWVWPAAGKVSQEYNEARNKGVSIAGKLGDPVLAAADGKALYVGSGIRGYGNLVIIKHNSNFVSVYAHNSNILVKEEQAIKKGQKIAEMGNSDVDTKEVKLHFEIRSQGKPVDPLKYLPSR